MEYSRLCYKGKNQGPWGFKKRRNHFLSKRAGLRKNLGRKGPLGRTREEETVLKDYGTGVRGRRKRKR